MTAGNPDAALAFEGLCAKYLRPVSGWTGDAIIGYTPSFEPPLTTAEQATLASLEALLRSTIALTPADWALIDARLPALRTFRQQTRNDFMALTQTARDRAIFDALQDIIAVLVAMLRD